jgi:type IV pilus assembly protein PilA
VADGGDDGFTMIELMVTLLVLAILLAIAIPTFLGTTNTANDRSAEANLVTALTDAQAQFQNGGQTYNVGGTSDAVAFGSLLTAAQLSLTFRAGLLGPSITQGSSGSASNVSVSVSLDGDGLVMAAYSVPGDCYYVIENESSLSAASTASTPYTGAHAVTTVPTTPAAGSLALPTSLGTSYVAVRGDTLKSDCNAFTPKTGGAATVQYLASGFPG